jgi:hypothetical protein
VKVTDPDGLTWRVRRRWLPWRLRRREPEVDPGPTGGGPEDLVVGVVVALLALLVPVVLVVVFAAFEALLLLVLLPFALLGRVLLGRRWTVEVRRGWTPWWEEQADDWSTAGVRIHALAEEIRRGAVPLQVLGRR